MDVHETITREAAAALGLKRFFDGIPCARGHIAEKAVVNRKCLICARDDYRARSPTYAAGLLAKQERDRKKAAAAQKRADLAAEWVATAPARRERSRALQKAWRAANRDRQRTNVRRWKRANRDSVRKDKRGRKLRRRASILDALFKSQRGRCAYCRDRVARAEAHVDHITPRVAGGTNRRSNLQMTCPTCNLAKGAQHPVAFAQSLGRLI